MKRLFIVIVSFNGGEILKELINTLAEEREVIIVVVDNGSSENIKRVPYGRKSNIEVIQRKKNLGFAKIANIGIKYALANNADGVLLLNQDTDIESDFLIPLINNPAHIVSPVIKFKRDNHWVYDFGGRVDWRWGRTKHIESTNYPCLAGRQAINQLTNKPIDYVSGCCMLIRKEVIEKIGFFDERFFLYFEDVDFCLRAKKAGFKIAVEPKSEIIHHLTEGKNKSIFQRWYLWKSNFLFINKYLGVKRILGYLYLSALAVKMIL